MGAGGQGRAGLSALALGFGLMVAWGCEEAVLMWDGPFAPPEGGTGRRNRRVKIVVVFLFRIWARGLGAGRSERSGEPRRGLVWVQSRPYF